ncbi:helix-turn-helix domain-containing protein [Paenibacillus sp. LMG 31456]|uniref:Helix-turn-helix domain-containing protein n=1 Tax=Paenibacillus foliorum TaxID=2654974 RepID=A0A972GJU5_9BACL|nr:helix-turn-helix domain-containing protein [Paenibacillus foliorum]
MFGGDAQVWDIRSEFGTRVKELRSRSGMSQELLAHRSELDRTYISGVEQGQRNVSLVNIQRIAEALNVSIEYLFSGERFSTSPAYQKKDFALPFLERFKYEIDSEKRILSFQVYGLLTGENVDYMAATLLGICSAFGKGELNVFVDHREMKTADGEPAVYSLEVAERAVIFQQGLTNYSNKVVLLCNSEFMVQQMNHVTTASGISDKSIHLYGQDQDMINKAYQLLDINGSSLIKTI